MVPFSLPTPAQGVGCRRIAAALIPPYFPSTLLCIPPILQTCLQSHELCIVITSLSFLHSLKSFHHSKLVTSPRKWEQQLLWGRSHVPCSPVLQPPQSSGTTAVTSTASHSLFHRENHRQGCVFQRETSVRMRWMILTASPLLHRSLKSRCGLDFLQSWPYPNKMFLPPQTSSEIHSWHFLATLPSFGVCLCVMDSVESQEGKVEGRTETTCRVSSCLPLEPDPNDITAAGSFFALVFQVCKRELWFSPAENYSVYT